jgi:hypothetical protein
LAATRIEGADDLKDPIRVVFGHSRLHALAAPQASGRSKFSKAPTTVLLFLVVLGWLGCLHILERVHRRIRVEPWHIGPEGQY